MLCEPYSGCRPTQVGPRFGFALHYMKPGWPPWAQFLRWPHGVHLGFKPPKTFFVHRTRLGKPIVVSSTSKFKLQPKFWPQQIRDFLSMGRSSCFRFSSNAQRNEFWDIGLPKLVVRFTPNYVHNFLVMQPNVFWSGFLYLKFLKCSFWVFWKTLGKIGPCTFGVFFSRN